MFDFMRKLLISITALAVLGVAVSSYALWQHYAPLGAAFCNFSETFSCDIVNQSAFSEVFGIPVALIGILGYAGIGVLAMVAYKTISPPFSKGEREGVRVQTNRGWGIHSILRWLLAASLGGLVFSLCLTYIEIVWIGAYCPICIVSQVLILAIAALATIAFRCSRRVPTHDDGTHGGTMSVRSQSVR